MKRRKSVRARVLYAAGRTEGEAILTNVSSAGALLEDASACPPVDADVRLVFEAAQTLQLVGVVVRHTGSGFAVRFKRHSEEILTLLEELEDVFLSDKYEER